jgi:hypothetical protein
MAKDGEIIPEPTVFPGQVTLSVPVVVPHARKTA